MACDFRFQKDALKGLKFAVCGLGNSLYNENFNKVAIELDKSLGELRGTRIHPLYCCDENTLKSKNSSLEGDFEFWSRGFIDEINKLVQKKSPNGGCCNDSGSKADNCCRNNANGETESDKEY